MDRLYAEASLALKSGVGQGPDQTGEDLPAIGAAMGVFGGTLGMGHHAQHPAVLAQHPGDVPGGPVTGSA